ncbi:hypothetical protein ACHAXA_002025 [Cyclostephanos tholiformis]|uniref:Uncharacterized protein n=1 Tax=Cyclostephanos tholiformis TaxID=382380 RepID=A0ABD3SSU8_9STRA
MIIGGRKQHRLPCNLCDNHDASVRNSLNFVPFKSSSSLSIQRLYGNQQKTIKFPSFLPPNSRCSEIHSTTTMMMGRKKNGGRRKRSNSKSMHGINELEDEVSGMVEQTFNANENNHHGILDENSEDHESKFAATFASQYHAPVMLTECVDALLQRGEWCQMLLDHVLIGCDVDPEALSTASNRLSDYLATFEYILDMKQHNAPNCGWAEARPMFIPVQSNFRNLISVLSKIRNPVTGKLLLGDRGMTNHKNTINKIDVPDVEFPTGVNGMLLDLGVSSHQIDTAERGFAFMKEGPLDMRMSGKSQSSLLTAADICNEFDEAALIDILRTYGDEPKARRIAAAIVASRPLHTTTDLVHAINSVTPTFARQKRAGLIATSARVFQALRIVVNEEDGALKEVLERVAPWALARSTIEGGDDIVDGILAVLSYHSMEDKMTKRVIRDGKVDFFDTGRRETPERDLFGNIFKDGTGVTHAPFAPLTKPRKASDDEVAANSRSRSATLRVAIRI